MHYQYHVDVFVPPAPGCKKSDMGWDKDRCQQFAEFLSKYGSQGWKLHSAEYRTVSSVGGCGSNTGAWLVCVFERQAE